jgi:type I restriction enzyme R subunit
MNFCDGELFDSKADFDQWNRTRPHRHQPAAVCFLTMRLNDSIPASVIQNWHRERVDFLRRHGVVVERDWKAGYEKLSPDEQQHFDKHFSRQRETTLDSCLGACELANPIASQEVASSLTKFHGDRYWLGDFVIMPNHVHCLVAFQSSKIAKSQPGGWMRYSARQINKLTGRTGVLWFPEPFDHLVRNTEQLRYLRTYIRDNPKKARIAEGRFLYRASGGRF